MNEATPVVLVYANQQDYQRGVITMFTEKDGKIVKHGEIQQSKIIDGNDLIIKQEIVS